MVPGPAVYQEAPGGQGCSHVPQHPARYGPFRGYLLTGAYLGPAHFQQPLTLPHLEPVQGLSPTPGQGHGFLGHWEGLGPCSSWV